MSIDISVALIVIFCFRSGRKQAVADDTIVQKTLLECADPIQILRQYSYTDLAEGVKKLAVKVRVNQICFKSLKFPTATLT